VSCDKWHGTVDALRVEATTACDAMSAGGDVHCLVDLPPQKIASCHTLLRGEGQKLKQLERKVKVSSADVEKLSEIMLGLDSREEAQLRLIGEDKENHRG